MGYKELKGDARSALQPQIRVVSEGAKVSARPILLDDDRVRLECRVMLSRIGEIKTKTFKQTSAGSNITIQMPEVTKQEVETGVEMRLGQTLVIGGLLGKKVGQDQRESMIVTIRPTLPEKKSRTLTQAMLK
jgi:type II secretory pathway component GspD/PulD (secretin)